MKKGKITTWCDLCGSKIGTKIDMMVGRSFYSTDLHWAHFTKGDKEYADVCNTCEKELQDMVHNKLEAIKYGRKKHETTNSTGPT